FIILVTLVAAVFAERLAPYDPYKASLADALAPPSGKHLLGTDSIGRDTLSRIIFGARTSLVIGLSAIAIASFLGMSLGLIAGYYGGWVYAVIMRFIDALMSFPMILLALVIAALLGGGVVNVVLALGISQMPSYARLMCAQVLSVKETDYVLAARALGATNTRIMLRHVVPNCLPPLIVLVTMMLGAVILAEAGLSFLGIGIEAPTAAWGAMVSSGREYLASHPVMSIAPGAAIMLVVFAFNMVGDGLRDALDPRLRGVI
ncbi:MAG: ABC transporter permease, partial [Dehalococcoidales bacterium]|nr:ABC transporter permease [Dehalococcoidales bacterium]